MIDRNGTILVAWMIVSDYSLNVLIVMELRVRLVDLVVVHCILHSKILEQELM